MAFSAYLRYVVLLGVWAVLAGLILARPEWGRGQWLLLLLETACAFALLGLWHGAERERSLKSQQVLQQSLQDALRDLYSKNSDENQDLIMARRVHQGLLSLVEPKLPGLAVASRNIPAQSLGGDFFAFVERHSDPYLHPTQKGIVEYRGKDESSLGVIIGDVAGHGVSSALVMALSNGLMTEIGKNTRAPSQVLQLANDRIHTFIHTSSIKYVTAFYGVLSLESGLFRYAKGGHVCPFLLRQDQWVELESAGIFLGMYPGETYEEQEVQLHLGDRLVFYTDGVTEARNPDGEMFGDERLREVLISSRRQTPNLALDALIEQHQQFCQGRPVKDDLTVVLLDYTGAGVVN